MHQTTYGETHKVDLYSRSHIDDFIDREEKLYNSNQLKDCLYQSKIFVSKKSLNYLNLLSENNVDNELKKIISKAYDECDKIYPYLGELFLEGYFNNKEIKPNKRNIFKFSKREENKLINTLKHEETKDIARYIFNNTSLERNIIVDYHDDKDVFLKTFNDINLNVEYDIDFLANKFSHEMKSFRYILVDGYIESIGEVHHLLTKAAENKEPYVLFCFGMSEEVKMTILKNNAIGKTEIFPVVMTVEENTVNILNDIAVVLSCGIVNSLKGQTISQCMREELPVGSNIEFFKNKIRIKPMCTELDLSIHRDFIRSKIKNLDPGYSPKFLLDRLKSLSSKTLKIFIPDTYKVERSRVRDIDYFLRFLYNVNKQMTLLSLSNNEEKLFIPVSVLEFLNKKINSTRFLFNNIDRAIILKKE